MYYVQINICNTETDLCRLTMTAMKNFFRVWLLCWTRSLGREETSTSPGVSQIPMVYPLVMSKQLLKMAIYSGFSH